MTVLLIGAGPMALAYAKVLGGLDVPFEVIGQGARSAAEFAQATGKRPLEGGLSAYLASHSVKASNPVIVALPIGKLAAATLQLIASGARRILVEKPAGLNAEEIDQVAAAAYAANAEVYVGFNRRFYSSVAAARAMIAEDGGVSSFHIEFTEFVERILTSDKDPAVLANWLLANSFHVLDIAFHLGGEPASMTGITAGSLPWHPAGAVFAGHGRTNAGALFTWHADWTSAGRWSLDLRTPRRRLLLQPLESLQVQEKTSLILKEVTLSDEIDSIYKPGICREVQAFLSASPTETALPSISTHAKAVRRWFLPMLSRNVTLETVDTGDSPIDMAARS